MRCQYTNTTQWLRCHCSISTSSLVLLVSLLICRKAFSSDETMADRDDVVQRSLHSIQVNFPTIKRRRCNGNFSSYECNADATFGELPDLSPVRSQELLSDRFVEPINYELLSDSSILHRLMSALSFLGEKWLQLRDVSLQSLIRNMCNNGLRPMQALLHDRRRRQRRGARDRPRQAWLQSIIDGSAANTNNNTDATIAVDDEKISVTAHIPALPSKGMHLQDIQLSISDGTALIKQTYARRPASARARRTGAAKAVTMTKSLNLPLDKRIDFLEGAIGMRDVETTTSKDEDPTFVAWKL